MNTSKSLIEKKDSQSAYVAQDVSKANTSAMSEKAKSETQREIHDKLTRAKLEKVYSQKIIEYGEYRKSEEYKKTKEYNQMRKNLSLINRKMIQVVEEYKDKSGTDKEIEDIVKDDPHGGIWIYKNFLMNFLALKSQYQHLKLDNTDSLNDEIEETIYSIEKIISESKSVIERPTDQNKEETDFTQLISASEKIKFLKQEFNITFEYNKNNKTIEIDNFLNIIFKEWSNLPINHVAKNPYVETVEIDNKPYETNNYLTGGLQAGSKITYYVDSDGHLSRKDEYYRETIVHELGHAVHNLDYSLLESLMGATGWLSISEPELRIRLLKMNKPIIDGTMIDTELMKIKNGIKSQINLGGYVISLLDKKLETFYIRDFGTMPGEKLDIANDPRLLADFNYAKTAPHEQFAEYYRMIHEDSSKLYDILNSDESLKKQWDVMRNKVFKVEQEIECIFKKLEHDLKEAHNIDTLEKFKYRINQDDSLEKVGTPNKLRNLKYVKFLLTMNKYIQDSDYTDIKYNIINCKEEEDIMKIIRAKNESDANEANARRKLGKVAETGVDDFEQDWS